MPRLQHVADECRAHVVLCPGTRLRPRDNREYHTEKLRGGNWALIGGMHNDLLTSDQETRLLQNCAAPAIIAGRGGMVRLRNGRFDWTVQVGYPLSLTESGVRRRAQEKAIRLTLEFLQKKKKHCRGKAEKHTDSGTGFQLGLGAEGIK